MKYIFIILILALYICLHILYKNNKIKKNLSIILKALLIAVFLEITIFNIKAYRLDFSKAQEISFFEEEIEDMQVENNGFSKVNLENIDTEIKTIYVKFKNLNPNDYIEYQISYSDETTKERNLPKKEYFEKIEESQYTAVYLSGKVESLSISYSKDSELEEIQLNTPIPFNFNIFRTIIVTLIILLIYSLKTHSFWQEAYTKENVKGQRVYFLILTFFILILCFFNIFNEYIETDLYNKDFVEALENGQTYLLEEPSEKLLSLENPYDTVERSSIKRGEDYIWDTALYNNHYYVYFGILPALILFLPFHIITGTFLKTSVVVLLFSVLSAIMLALIIEYIFKKHFSKLPFKMLVFSEISILFGSFLIWINVAPRFYEMVNVAGLYFSLQGIYLFLTIKKGGELSFKKLGLGALCLALAVACRPTTLIASIIIIPIIWNLFMQKKANKKEVLKLILVVMIPYIVVGLLLMYYNYIRFGSIFEFGAKYQLTMNDMRNLKNRLITIPAGLIYNLFNLPSFIGEFPFMQVNSNIPEIFAYYYVEDMPGGVFILAPIAFAVFGIKKFFKTSKNTELKNLVVVILAVGIILNIIIVMQGGSTGRYLLDFAWYFVLAGILIYLENYQNTKTVEAKKILEKIFVGLMSFTLIINILTGFLTTSGVGMKRVSPQVYFNVEYSISFWK